MKELINIYKYRSVRACGEVIAQMIVECMKVPENAFLVPLPTIGKHIRERGFDHTSKLAHQIARQAKCKVSPILMRVNKSMQVGASFEERQIQAKTAYKLRNNVDRLRKYYLLDDV